MEEVEAKTPSLKRRDDKNTNQTSNKKKTLEKKK
jgi:hypothetical protein